MTIGIDMSPLKSGHYLQHRVRGTGFYLKNLRASLEKYYPENKYIDFDRGDALDKKIDLVHYPYFEPFFLTLPVFPKNKTVVTVHDLTPLVFPDNFKSGLKGNLKWQIQKIALRNASAIITDSGSSKNDIVKHTGIKSSKIHVVYLSAGEEFKKIQDSKLKIKNLKNKYRLPEKFALYVGDVTWNKNLPRLIEAIKKTKISLVMVGSALVEKNVDLSNPWNADLTEVLDLIDGDKRIIRLGFVSNEELVLLYNMATVFTMPSIYEGFGLPVLEAMSCGCSVVTSKEGSIPEIVGAAAMYVDAYSVESIAKGIRETINSQGLRASLSEKGLIQSRRFTWKKTAGETMRVYSQIVGR